MILPGSKSLTNRDLILAVLTPQTTVLHGVLFSEDTHVMMEALQSLGFIIEVNEANLTVTIEGGIDQLHAQGQTLFLGNSGTSIRFLTALCCLISSGSVTLTGVHRMCQRPIGELTQALRNLGAIIEDTHGYPPLTIYAGAITKNEVTIDGSISSQFITALMMIGSQLPDGLTIHVQNTLTSIPYVRMTQNEMQKFNMQVEELTEKKIQIAPQKKQSKENKKKDLIVEGDASALSYWALYSILLKKEIIIENLGTNTQQGDYQFLDMLQPFGLEVKTTEHSTTMTGHTIGLSHSSTEYIYDFSDMPDVSMTFFILAIFLPGDTHITGLHTLNKKECRRIEAMGTEIKKLGVPVTWNEESITIGTLDEKMWKDHEPVNIETYDDHRIAMCFGILGEYIGKLHILNPLCVNKTYPQFWDDLSIVKNS